MHELINWDTNILQIKISLHSRVSDAITFFKYSYKYTRYYSRYSWSHTEPLTVTQLNAQTRYIIAKYAQKLLVAFSADCTIKHTKKFPEKCLALELRCRKKIPRATTTLSRISQLCGSYLSVHPANVSSSFIATCRYATQISNVMQANSRNSCKCIFSPLWPEMKSLEDMCFRELSCFPTGR